MMSISYEMAEMWMESIEEYTEWPIGWSDEGTDFFDAEAVAEMMAEICGE